MSVLQALSDRIDRLLLRHEELQRSHRLMTQQLQDMTAERDQLRARLGAARARIDGLLNRIPPDVDGEPR